MVVSRIALLNSQVAGVAFVQRCRQAGIQVAILQLAAGSSQTKIRQLHADAQMDWSLLGTAEGLKQIQNFLRRHDCEALVTADEFALLWLSQHRDALGAGCRLLAPDAAVIELLRTKDQQYAIAAAAGIAVLPMWKIESQGPPPIPAGSYPICLRPSTFSSVQPMFKAETFHSEADLQRFLSTIQWTAPLLAQPLASGPNMVVHGCRDEYGAWLDLRAYLAPVKAQGLAIVLEETAFPAGLEAACRNFVELSGATGCFHFDLLHSESNGKIYFLELNLRLGGSTAKVLQLGLDEPVLLLRAYGLRPASPPPPIPAAKAAGSMRMLLAHTVSVATARSAEIAFPRSRTLGTFRKLLHYALSMRDPSLPGFANYLSLIRALVFNQSPLATDSPVTEELQLTEHDRHLLKLRVNSGKRERAA